MFPFDAEYVVTVKDLRKATYYSTVRERRKSFLLMFVAVSAAVVYAIAVSLGANLPGTFLYFIGGAYLIWGLIQFGKAEKSIRAYIKTESNLLEVPYKTTFTTSDMRMTVPSRGIDNKFGYGRVVYAFELSDIMMFYISGDQVYIVPKRAIPDEKQEALRGLLRKKLPGRFLSRFDKKEKDE